MSLDNPIYFVFLYKLAFYIFSDNNSPNITELRDDVSFKVYLLKVTTRQIETYLALPDYRHVKHSRRMFNFLCEVTKVIFASLKSVYDSEGGDVTTASLSVECFRQCLITSETVYKRKLEEFFTHLGAGALNGNLYHEQILLIIETIHGLLEKSLAAEWVSGVESKKMQHSLLHCLEILYSHLPPEHSECSAVASWLHNFCLNNVIDGKYLDGIFRLLFMQRLKYFDGDFFNSVALQLSKVFGTLTEAVGVPSFELKAITTFTAEQAFLHLCAVLKKDIDDVEVTVLKVKSMAAKIKFLGEKGADDDRRLMKLPWLILMFNRIPSFQIFNLLKQWKGLFVLI